ncbi:transaldolase [Sphaerotilus hippei]|uniref:Transaldolase n=1 Tax=Sphaerotilus hippei TaxID=744406 RepID=A0A318GXD6_9BURK|nr:transketolase [Sphaerotilus hippei]PXW94395.1 transaldolase [Sphaerotilus hippei]
MTAPTRTTLANALRVLAMDAVQQANSGHPGMPMGMADIAEALWRHTLRHNPANPKWPNRDRFVLSNGHGSMLLYGLLHLTGYDLPIEQIKRFRQLHSQTPGHPELGYTPGVETTTGPLGQGIANAVGLALAEQLLAAEFNRDGLPVVDHHTYVFLGDGCLMEGVSHEACSLAGTWGLGKLVAFWDDNGISIDGHVEGWFTDDTPGRFEAYGWQVIRGVDGHDPAALDAAIAAARAESAKPTLICCRTVIGKGSPNKAGTHDSHGAPLGTAEIAASRAALGWTHAPFEIPAEVGAAWDAREAGARAEAAWNESFAAYERAHPALAAEFRRRMAGELPAGFADLAEAALAQVVDQGETIASRKASQNAIAALVPALPEMVGGSADLAGSNLTLWPQSRNVMSPEGGNYVHYGVREFGMAAIMNGLTLHGGLRSFGGTFLMFSEYARNALRMAALMKLNPIYVFTHDSIGLGEDGPTHQPVEQTATLRLIPNMDVWRPADAVETQVAWTAAIESTDHPTSLILSRQNLPHNARSAEQLAAIRRGGYVVSEASGGAARAVIIATGSELGLAIAAQKQLAAQGVPVRVVSMPSTNVFDRQDAAWRDSVLPKGLPRVAVEAGVSDFWRKYVGLEGAVVGIDRFGESAPAGELYKLFGVTADAVAAATLGVLGVSAKAGSRVAPVAAHGQQIWLDKLSRSLVASGELQRWVDEHAVAGVTSNPAIFAQALADDAAYAPALAELRGVEPDLERRFELLAIPDVQAACDVLRPLYERSHGDAGYVSFEVSPSLSRDGAGTLAAARRLWAQIARPNAMIKIPSTPDCLEAISAALADGININVTLMFSPRQVRQVFTACTEGLRRRHAAGLPLAAVRSVASLFVSRVDTLVDAQPGASTDGLSGEVGIANARAAYATWLDTYGGAAFAGLRAAGATPPLCLWASTGVKNPAWRDTCYVEALIGPRTVNTVPDATLAAFADHGETARTLDTDLPGAWAVLARAAAAGIDLDTLGEQLQAEGLKQFEQAFERLLQSVR